MEKWIPILEALSVLPILKEIDETKTTLEALRPLPTDVENRVMQKLRLDWNYQSNALEGNQLTLGETYTFLMYGLTAKGKPLKDHLDIRGHNEALNFLISLTKESDDLREVDIRNLHRMVLVEPYLIRSNTAEGIETTKRIKLGVYKKMPNQVLTPTGEIHYFAAPEEVPILMGTLINFINQARSNATIHPSVLAAFFHHQFVAIHPFDDGNGRLGRILMNLMLMRAGFPPAIIRKNERNEYIAALSQANANDYAPFVEFVSEALLKSMNLYLKAAKGGRIDDDEDLEKEIALLKMSLDQTFKARNEEDCKALISNAFLKIFDESAVTLNRFDDLFADKKMTIVANNDVYERAIFEKTLSHSLFSNKFTIVYALKNYLKSENTFDFQTALTLNFENNFYEITADGDSIIKKNYGEILSDFDIAEIVKVWLRIMLQNLKKIIAPETPPQY